MSTPAVVSRVVRKSLKACEGVFRPQLLVMQLCQNFLIEHNFVVINADNGPDCLLM